MGSSSESIALTRPTRVRYQVLTYLCVLAFIFYVDRTCISKAAPRIAADLGLSATQMGFVFAAFTLAYCLFEVPTGAWGDRYGSRGVLTRIVLWWSAFTALTGCVWAFEWDSGLMIPLPDPAEGLVIPLFDIEVTFPFDLPAGVPLLFNSFLLLMLIRFLFGAGEAGAFPNTARILSRWFPVESRSTPQGLINASALVGGAVAPVVAAYLIELFDWRWAFVLFAVPGVVWAAAFYGWFRDDPAEHPAVNESERRLIAAGTFAAAPPHAIPWRAALTSANVWLLGAVISCTAFNSYLYFFWYPTYLERARGVDAITSGWLTSLVLASGAVGSTAGGAIADRLIRATGDRRWSRRGLGFVALASAGLLLLVSVNTDSAVLSALWAAAAVFAAFTTLASWWGAVTDISGRHLGALFGLLNSLGGVGAIASQLFLGSFADRMGALGYTGRDQWDPAFYVYAGVLGLGALGWLLIDSTRPIEPATPPA